MKRTRKSPPGDPYEPVHLDNDDQAETADGVLIQRTATGRAVIVPRSLRGVTGEAAEAVAEMQRAAAEIHRWQDRLEAAVRESRDVGVSWAAIGWCVGTSGDAARKRWGVES